MHSFDIKNISQIELSAATKENPIHIVSLYEYIEVFHGPRSGSALLQKYNQNPNGVGYSNLPDHSIFLFSPQSDSVYSSLFMNVVYVILRIWLYFFP